MLQNATLVPVHDSRHKFETVEIVPSDISLWLSLYKSDAILIRRASYSKDLIRATLGHYPLDFHRAPLSHLSRVQIVHLVGQVGFVFVGSMVRDRMVPDMTEESYVEAISSERVTFRKLSLEFREFLPNEAGTQIEMWCRRIRKVKSGVLLDLVFSLNKGACRGEAHGLILNDQPRLPIRAA